MTQLIYTASTMYTWIQNVNKIFPFGKVTLMILDPEGHSVCFPLLFEELQRGGWGCCFSGQGQLQGIFWNSVRVQMTFPSGCFIATNWKTHWCLSTDLSTGRMWLQSWTCVSVLVETPLTFHWKWFLNTNWTRHDKVWAVVLQVTSPLPSPLWASKDPKRWPVCTMGCAMLCASAPWGASHSACWHALEVNTS